MNDDTPRDDAEETADDRPARKRTYAGRWLNNSSSPIFMIDVRRRIVFFNSGCEKLLGWSADDVHGRLCEYTIDDPQDRREQLTCSLCPPPSVLQGEAISAPAHLVRHDGSTLPQLIHFFPISGTADDIAFALGVLQPLPPPSKTPTSAAQQLHAELAGVRAEIRQRYGLENVIALSAGMQRVLRQIQLAIGSTASVWLHGEAGTGREHIARVIHNASEFQDRAFIPLDCASTPGIDLKLTIRRLLCDAETKPDHLTPGSVYLQNIAALPRDSQTELLELVDDVGTFRMATGQAVRLMAESKERPEELLPRDLFLPEFHALLTTVDIGCPPLRERMVAFELLAQQFLERGNRGQRNQIGGFHPDVLQQFQDYNWPGNLAELQQVISEMRTACGSDPQLRVEHLPFRFRTGVDAQAEGPEIPVAKISLEELLADTERTHIQRALDATSNNKTRAAELLGMTRNRLLRRMAALNLK